jgi:hypothetical protein
VVGLEVVDHEYYVSMLHELLDSILQASLEVGLLILIVLEVLLVLHEELHLDVGHLGFEFFVHQDALLVFAYVRDVVVNKVDVERVSQLLIVDDNKAIRLVQPDDCQQRLPESLRELRWLVELGGIEFHHDNVIEDGGNLKAFVLP